MDTSLAIASKREVRRYDGRALPECRLRRLLRVRNRQQLEVAAAQRDDAVVGAHAVVAPPAGGGEAVAPLE